MRSQPGTGWFIAVVVTALLAGGWPGIDERAQASRGERMWRPAECGFGLRVPSGWLVSRLDGAQLLVREPLDAGRGMLSFRVEPDTSTGADGVWFEALAESFEATAHYHASEVRRLAVSGRPTLRVDWTGTPLGAGCVWQGVDLFCDRGTTQLTLEIKARESDWPEIGAEVERMLASLELDAR